jgi:hypothetical protein
MPLVVGRRCHRRSERIASEFGHCRRATRRLQQGRPSPGGRCGLLSSSCCSIFLAESIARGARHGISRIGTGGPAALGRCSSEGLSALSKGGSGDQGGSSGLPASANGSLHRCSRTIVPWDPFRDEVNIPLDPPSPRRGRARDHGMTGDCRRGGPLLDRIESGFAGPPGGARVAGVTPMGRQPSCPYSIG